MQNNAFKSKILNLKMKLSFTDTLDLPAINSLVEFKKKKLDRLKEWKNVSSATKQIQEEQQVLQCMIVNVADAPAHALTQLSLGGLTCVSNKMIKSGGDLLLEFTKVCGTTCKLKQDTPLLSKKVVASDELSKCFKDCLNSLEIADHCF